MPQIFTVIEPSFSSCEKPQSSFSMGRSCFRESMISLTFLTKLQMASLFLSEKSFMESGLFGPSAFAVLSHGLNLLEVFRAALGGCFSATATEGNGCCIFLCHAQKATKSGCSLQEGFMYKLQESFPSTLAPYRATLTSSPSPSVLPDRHALTRRRRRV